MTTKLRLVFSLIFCSVISQKGSAQCYFSARGDSILYADGYQVSWDSVQCTFWFWYTTLVSKPGDFSPIVTGNFRGTYTVPLETGGFIPDYVFPDSIRRNYPFMAEDLYYPEQIDTLIDLDLDMHSVKRLHYEMGWCSKGCSWTSYYRTETDFSFSIQGKPAWNVYFENLYFIHGDYIAWGKKPHRRGKVYFEIHPYDCMQVDCYHLIQAGKYFIRFRYSTVPIKDNNQTNYPEVYFLFE